MQKELSDDMEVGVAVFNDSGQKLGYFSLSVAEIRDTVKRGHLHCWSYKEVFVPNECFHPHSFTPIPDANDSSIKGHFTLLPILGGQDLKGFKLEGDPALIRQFDNFEELQ